MNIRTVERPEDCHEACIKMWQTLHGNGQQGLCDDVTELLVIVKGSEVDKIEGLIPMTKQIVVDLKEMKKRPKNRRDMARDIFYFMSFGVIVATFILNCFGG